MQWIEDSIKANYVLEKSTYNMYCNELPNALKLNIGKRKRYTVMEGVTLYSLLGAGKYGKVANEKYKDIERGRVLPERGFESMKNFWKEYSCKTLERYLIEAIYYKYDFCLSFKDFPNPEFVDLHRQKYADEFQQLEQE